MKSYPKATERFDTANFHINYCLSFMKKYIGKSFRNWQDVEFFKKLY